MTTENKIMVRGDNETLTWTYSGDLTARKLVFVVKANRTLTTARTIERKNVAAGGGATQLSASYSAETGLTTISVYMLPNLTSQLVAKDYWYDITSEHATTSDDHETILQGKFTLQGDVQTPYDSSVVVGELMANKFITFYVTNANTVAEVSGKAFGWTTNPTAVASGGVITVTSSESEFIVGKTRIFPTNSNINYPAPTTSSIVITVLEAEYPFSFDVWV